MKYQIHLSKGNVLTRGAAVYKNKTDVERALMSVGFPRANVREMKRVVDDSLLSGVSVFNHKDHERATLEALIVPTLY